MGNAALKQHAVRLLEQHAPLVVKAGRFPWFLDFLLTMHCSRHVAIATGPSIR